MKTFFGDDTQNVLHDICGRNFVGKSRTETFRESVGKLGQKSFSPPKNFLLIHLWLRWTTRASLEQPGGHLTIEMQEQLPTL